MRNNIIASFVRASLMGLVMAAGFPAFAEQFYLAPSCSGIAADFGQPATYGRDSGLPGTGDTLTVADGQVLLLTDANIATLSDRKTKVCLDAGSRMDIDISNSADFETEITYNSSHDDADVYKTGDGTLTLKLNDSPTYDTNNRYVGYNCRWRIKGGEVVLPQSGFPTATTLTHIDLIDVTNGCSMVNVNGRLRTSLAGDGDLRHRATGATRVTLLGPMDFSGRILQEDGAGNVTLYVSGGSRTVNLKGAGSTMGAAPHLSGGTVGVALFGQSGSPSSLGKSSKAIAVEANQKIVCLGEDEQDTNKAFQPGSGCSTFEVDGGAFGDATFTGAWDPTGAIMRSLVLSGSNTEHACVLQNTIADVGTGADTCSYHLVKKGTGVWRMSSANPKWSGAMTIEEGTLQFDSIAPAGTACSLGFATNLYADVPGTKDEANRVDWAVRLGNPGAGEVATLEYAGTAAVEWPTSRPIVVDGRGRFRNETGSAFMLSGVTAATAGSSLFLDGDAASGNKLNGVSDGAGTLKIVKEGTGDWTLAGDVDVSGGLDVKAGTLKIANRKNYNWFKVTVKQTFLGARGVTSASTVTLQEFALYDVNGVRQNQNPQIGNPQVGDAAGTLVPGGLAYGPCAAGSENRPLANMTLSDTANNWSYGVNVMPNPENPATWVSFVVRVPEGTPEIEKFDMRFHAKTEGEDKNFYSPRIVEIDGSADGLAWSPLTTVTNEALTTSYYYWLYGDHARYDAVRNPANSGRAFDRRAVVPDGERPEVALGGGMAVAASAALRIEGEPLEISRLELDFAAGVGSFDNLRLASSGTIVVKNVPKGAVTIPADFSGVENFDVIGSWPVLDQDGKPFKKTLTIRRDSVSVVPNGLMLILR